MVSWTPNSGCIVECASVLVHDACDGGTMAIDGALLMVMVKVNDPECIGRHAYDPHMPAKHVSNIHLDVLDGRDEVLDPVDFLPSNVTGENRLGSDMHSAMEQKWRV